MVIVGAGNFAKDILTSITKDVEDVVFYDLEHKKIEHFLGFKCLSSEDELKEYFEKDPDFITAIGDPFKRKEITQDVEKLGGNNVNYISSGAMIGETVTVAKKGVIIMGTAYIANGVVIDEGVIVYCHCGIGHDSHLKSYAFISSHVSMSSTIIGAGSYVGIGVKFKPGVSLGDNCFVGIGSIVTKTFPDNCAIVGFPARKVKDR